MSRIASSSPLYTGTLSVLALSMALLLCLRIAPAQASAPPATSVLGEQRAVDINDGATTGLNDEVALEIDAQTAFPADENVAPAVVAQSLPHDLSPRGMFMAADWVVKAVMIGLLFASLVTWTVWVVKTLELRASLKALAEPLASLSKAARLTDVLPEMKRAGPALSALTDATLDEMTHSSGLPVAGIKERVAMRLHRIEAAIGRKLNRGTGVLATIGSTAPFVGLFGTVWGIMNAFIGISKAQTTNLSVVAPGIAEALLATALGLVAAIPAVMIYNVFARALIEYRGRLADLTTEIQRVNARDLDREFVAAAGMNAAKAA